MSDAKDPMDLALEQAARTLTVATERACTSLNEATVKNLQLVERAVANGFATRKDVSKDTRSVNITTVSSMFGAVAVIFALVHFVIDPVAKQQEVQGATIERVITKQEKMSEEQSTTQRRVYEIQLDLREFYKVGDFGPSTRLAKPPLPVDGGP